MQVVKTAIWLLKLTGGDLGGVLPHGLTIILCLLSLYGNKIEPILVPLELKSRQRAGACFSINYSLT